VFMHIETRDEAPLGGEEAMLGWLLRYRWILLAVVLGCASAILLLAWPAGRRPSPPRARVYTQFNACLLTDANGVSGSAAAPVWAGMRAASLKTSGKVSFLAVDGPATAENAVPYVNTLVQRKCDLIIVVGAAEAAATRSQASVFPNARFVVVGSGSPARNVDVLEPSSDRAVSSAVETLVIRAAHR
jgi:hypothetical protein